MDNICIGAAQFGMPYGIANISGQPADNEVMKIVETATQNGIYFYDTAASYGSSETVLGAAFSDLGVADRVRCATKLPPDFSYDGYDDLRDAVMRSMEALRVKSLWGLLAHRTTIKGEWARFIEGIGRLKNEGLCLHFGISVYSPDDALRYANDTSIDIIQVPFNVLDGRLLKNGFRSVARRNNKIVFVRSVFLQGLLLMDRDQIVRKDMGWVLPHLSDLEQFIESNNVEAKRFLLKAVVQYWPDAVVIIGHESNEQLLKNIDLLRSENLPEEIMQDWWTNLPDYPERLLNPSLW